MNASAGAFNLSLATDVKKTLKASFGRLGIAAEIRFVDGNGLREAIERALVRARRNDIDAVVIGGGDGSVRTAASVLGGTSVPLGVLPLGTLNHFAKDLAIPSIWPKSTARRSSTIPRSASIPTWSSTVNGAGRTTGSPNGWRQCRRFSA
jgi:diacylglycerol kinase family enzyme